MKFREFRPRQGFSLLQQFANLRRQGNPLIQDISQKLLKLQQLTICHVSKQFLLPALAFCSVCGFSPLRSLGLILNSWHLILLSLLGGDDAENDQPLTRNGTSDAIQGETERNSCNTGKLRACCQIGIQMWGLSHP